MKVQVPSRLLVTSMSKARVDSPTLAYEGMVDMGKLSDGAIL